MHSESNYFFCAFLREIMKMMPEIGIVWKNRKIMIEKFQRDNMTIVHGQVCRMGSGLSSLKVC